MKRYLAIDIGGTFIKYGIFEEDGTNIIKEKEETLRNVEEFLNQILNKISEFEKKIKFNGIAISMAGFINVRTGENFDFSVSEIFTKYNLKTEIKKKTGYNVAIENDANCALLAEKWIGAGKNLNNIIVITFGTGIGGAIMINNKLVRGSNFRAGEFGIMNLGEDDEGNLKTAEATTPLVNRISKLLGYKIDGEYIFKNLDKDKRIKLIYDMWLANIAKIFSNVIIILDPEKILIGGGVSAQERFIVDLKEEVYRLYPYLREGLIIEKCKMENDAGMIGAIYNYIEEYEKII